MMKKKVYICAPLGGDVQGNLEKAKRFAKYALKCGTAPVVPHFYALCLNDNTPSEREMGMKSLPGCSVKSTSARISTSKPAL